MSKQSNSSTGQNIDPEDMATGSNRGKEIDDEIMGLRNALNQHLRDLDTPGAASSGQEGRLTLPVQSRYILHDNGLPSEARASNRFSVIIAAVLGGILSSLVVAIYLRSSGTTFSPQQSASSPQIPPATLNKSTGSDRTRNPGSEKEFSASPAQADRWQACIEHVVQYAEPPRPGETWWPIVGPSDSLDDARKFCRDDAFINRSGNAQIASFRDYNTAVRFAD
jgi:hypothetical protein